MKKHSVQEILDRIHTDYEFQGNSSIDYLDNIRSISDANEHSIVWCHPKREDKQQLIEKTAGRLIICDHSINRTSRLLKEKGFILVDNPKLTLSRLMKTIYDGRSDPGIHTTTTVHPDACIAGSAFIGPNCFIGMCTVGEDVIIHGNCFLYDGTTVGNNVVIEAGVILGAEGFGFAQNEKDEWERVTHIGGLEIHDDVEIGAGTTIDRGTLDNTIIGKGTKVSKSVHISHNVKIGKDCLITGCSTIAGSTTVGDRVWISPNATVLNKLSIGNDVFISAGAVVSHDIPDGFQALGRKVLPRNKK